MSCELVFAAGRVNLPNCRTFQSAIRLSFLFVSVATLSACLSQQSGAVDAISHDDEYMPLDLVGYNYTNHHIDDYSINGQGGGNIRVSSLTSGGSGIVCCVKLAKTGNRVVVRVRWQVGGCKYLMRSAISDYTQDYTSYSYKETDVEVQRGAGVRPSHVETHFYPDGSVKVQLTEALSLPKLSLNEERADKSPLLRCKDGKKPA